MGHLNYHSYGRMAERLGQYVPGAFVSATLVEILKQLVTEEEAELCSLMPLRIVPAEKMGLRSGRWALTRPGRRWIDWPVRV